MRVSSRLQCALLVVAVSPCWALAQSSPLTNADAGASASAQSPAATANSPSDLGAGAMTDRATGDVAPLPPATLAADPIPTPGSDASLTAASGAQGPTATSATAGIHSLAANQQLTRKQLADRAHMQDSDRTGLGRDAVLMIVGGAAIVAGAIVGGGGGTALIVVGAVVGLTGLVLILS